MKKRILIGSLIAAAITLGLFLASGNSVKLGGYEFNPFTNNLDKTGTSTSSGGGGTTTLQSTYIGYGSPTNLVTGSADFTFNSSTSQLSVPNVTTTNLTSTQICLTGDTCRTTWPTSGGGGSTTTLTTTEVAYGDSNNLVTSSPNFTFNSSTNQLAVTNVTSTAITSTILYASSAVGIGTTPNASSYALDIEMGSRDVRFKGSSIFGNGFITENSTSNQQWALGSAGSSGILGPSGAFYFYDNTSSFLSLVLTKTGLLGLGVTSPGSRVSLAASTTATGGIAFGTDTNLYRSAASSLTTDDHLYTASTTIAGGFFQTGMLDCDNAVTSKLLYDVTTGKYSCGTDQTGGGSGGGSNWQVDGNGDLTPTTTIDIALPAGLTIAGHTDFTTASGTSITSTNISVSGGLSFLPGSGASIYLNGGTLYLTTGGANIQGGGDSITLVGESAVNAELDLSGLTTNQVFTFPDDTGTFALTSDIPTFQTDGTPNGTQTLLNLIAGTNINLTDDGLGGVTFDVIPPTAFQVNGTPNISQSLLNLVEGTNINLTDDGLGGVTIDGVALPAFQTNGTPNGSQALLNLVQGTNITLTDDGLGGVTIDAAGGGGGGSTTTLAFSQIAFGSPDNTVTSSPNFTFNSSTLRLFVNGTVSSTDAIFLRATSTQFFGTNGVFTRATSTNFFATNAIFTSVTSTNLRVSGVTSLTDLSFTNATGTGRFLIATTTITGGLFQTGMSTCNADNQTLGYNATTGKFECGDDDTTSPVVSTTNANTWSFTDISPAAMVDNNTTEIFNDTTRPNIQPQSVHNSVLVTLDFQVIGGAANDTDVAVRVVRENDPGSTTPTCDLTSDYQVGSSIVGGSLATAFLTNVTDIQTARLSVVDSPATTTPVYYTVCSSVSSTLGSAPGSRALHVSLTEIQGSGGGTSREYTQIYTASTTWTKPVTSTGFIGVRAWCVGGGGGAGGAGTDSRVGGGGGGAGASYEYIPLASLTTPTTSVVVGIAGAGGAAGDNDGVAGGTSSFGSFITCTGGGGGNDGGSSSSGGAGGTGSGGDINGNGRAGADAGLYSDSYRAYGGCAGCNQGDPSTIQDNIAYSFSASGILGMYAGAGAQRVPSWSATSYTGGSGASFGGGGSGGQRAGGGATVAGGAGKQGVVVIQELYN